MHNSEIKTAHPEKLIRIRGDYFEMKLKLILPIIFFYDICLSSNVINFFEFEGGSILAAAAHPTNTFDSCSVIEHLSSLNVTVYYKENYKTEFQIGFLGLITSIKVVDDNDWAKAFYASALMKELSEKFYKYVKKHITNTAHPKKEITQQETRQRLEKAIKRKLDDAKAEDMTMWLLNWCWLNY